MKRVLIAVLFAAMAAHAGEIEWKANWGAYASDTTLTLNGTEVLDDWVLGLYQSTGTNPGEGFNSADLGANLLASTKVTISTSGPIPTWFFGLSTTQPLVANNIPIYTVLFNTTDSGVFTTTPSSYSYLIIDDVNSIAHDSGAAGVGFGSDAPYDISTVSANSWVAVPEPATALLLALGGGFAWLVRLKQRLS
jgi:hypothetical protein